MHNKLYHYRFFWLYLSMIGFAFTPGISMGLPESSSIVFERIGIKEGLPFSQVSDIDQDSKGFLWIASTNGLIRYDGYNFRLFLNDKDDTLSIRYNNIKKLYPVKNGDIWFSYFSKGLGRFDQKNEVFISYFSGESGSMGLTNDLITQVLEDNFGQIWLGTSEGIFAFESITGQFIKIYTKGETKDCISEQTINTIYEDRQLNLWIGTQNGLYFRDALSGIFFQIANEPENHNSLSNSRVNVISQAPDDAIWVGTSWGLNRLIEYPVQNGELRDVVFKRSFFNEIPTEYSKWRTIYSLEFDKFGNLWVGTGQGLSLLNSGGNKPYQKSHFFYQPEYLNHLGDNLIASIKTDSRGNVWFFSKNNDLGLGMYAPGEEKFQFYRNEPGNPWSLSNNRVNNIFEDKSGTLWISCTRGGLNKVDLYSNNPGFMFPIPGARQSLNAADVYSIYHDTLRNTLWAGTIKGLNRINLENGEVRVFEHRSNSKRHLAGNIVGVIRPDPEGFLWIGYYDYKVSKYYPDRDYFEHYEFHPGIPEVFGGWSVRDIYIDSNTDVWFATWSSGLYIYKRDKDIFEHFSLAGDLSSEKVEPRVNKVLEADKGVYLIGTNDDGLFLYNSSSGNIKNFRETSDSLNVSPDVINDIYADTGGQVWLGTNQGLCNFKLPEEIFIKHKVNISPLDNIIYSIARARDGSIWVATGNGIKRFDPVSNEFNNYSVQNPLYVNEYNSRSVHWSPCGNLYFGGINGIIYFNPEEITTNPFEPDVEITSLKIMNRAMGAGGRLNGQIILDNGISESERITLNYRNNDFAIEFAALHFGSPQANNYAYKLEGFDREWKYTNAENRWATYTNLPPGEYTLRVIASNKDDIWNLEGRSLSIAILPAWYQSQLFKIALILFIAFGVLLFVRLRTNNLKQQGKKLERLVLERTEKISEMNEAKTRFFTNLSHEIRTPLTLILGPLDKMTENGKQPPEISEDLNIVKRNAYRLLKLVNQLLDFRKVESGEIKPSLTGGELKTFLQNLTELFIPLAKSQGVNLNTNCSFSELHVSFDHDILEKILFNLLSNGIKNTPEGGEVILECDAIDRQENRVKIKLMVRDTGRGIPKGELPYVFNSFYQGGNPENLTPNSSGIGLAYTRELVQLINGSIRVESEPGAGSKFMVEMELQLQPGEAFEENLSLNRMEKLKIKLKQDAHESGTDEAFSFDANAKNPLLLVVEDDRDMARFIGSCLSNDFNLVFAQDGEKGFEKALEVTPDIIISDLMMPVLDGYKLCQMLKQDRRTSHIPLIMLTAKSSDDSRLKGLQTGVEAYLGKPFNADILKAQVNSLLRSRKLVQEKLRNLGWLKIKDVEIASPDQQFLESLVALIDEKIGEDELDAGFLAGELAMSKSQLYRKVKALTGLSVHLFIRDLKLTRAAQLLKGNSLRISDVAFMTGFNNVSYFTRSFSEKFGKSPSEYLHSTRE